MAQLRQDYAQFTARGAAILVVAPDDPDAVRAYWSKHDLPFPALPDPAHQVADLYGQEVKLLRFGRMPALMIVDRAGRIRYSHHAASMSDIPGNDELLAILDQLNQEA